MYYKCPNCNGKIETLDYKAYTTEYGTMDIESGEIEYGDSDTSESWTECPLCGNNLDADELMEWDEIEDEIKNSEEPKSLEETPGAKATFKGKSIYESNDGQEDQILAYTHICPKCLYGFLKERTDDFEPRFIKKQRKAICPECNTEFSENEETKATEKRVKKNKTIIKIK